MDDSLGPVIMIYGVLLCVHLVICGLVALLALIVAEKKLKAKLKFLPILLLTLLPGILLFVVFKCLSLEMNDTQELVFWCLYSLLTIVGTWFGIKRSRKIPAE